MKSKSWLRAVAAVFALASAASVMADDTYPSHPVRIIVNVAPGGLTDVVTRLVAQRMSETLGKGVTVENRSGGDGLVGIRYVKAAAPDGYTILAAAGTIAIQPSVKLEPGYDLNKDFVGIGPMARSPLLMVESSDLPDKSLADFVARAKANPNKLSYGSAGVGSTTHLGAALFFKRAGVSLLHVPYKGNGAAMTDVLSGRVATIFDAYGSSVANVKAGKLRVLGVTSTARLASLPNVPTMAEQGYPDFSYYLYLCLVAPAGTPPAVVQRLSDALHAATASKELMARFSDNGLEPMTMQPAQFSQFLKQDETNMSKVVAELGIEKR
ncbi:Bug family tripartite tricarboxylate transporter substrate binding protein [Paraburkholderia sp. HD33-4]|uniref:Bug family tripartite tricarboxylate transporter substrate binding protein n=1 Tax=Paraburkholderia sp. HD33-4 TaxID=2883242 RepID=UPI001F2A4A5F|nr:tripartite tricarboxylate transporter substrate binding protein [Paraburkholderia sp. HD33-4]